MIKDQFTNLKLSTNNLHLKNIFSVDSYLELGNVDYNAIKRLLNYEMVNVKDICSFEIFNKGVGRSLLKDEALANYIPYKFFKSMTDKDGLRQLFITYGILKYVNADKKEVFMPILLIPVEMIFDHMDIYFKMLQKPIENPLIASTFTENTKGVFPTIEKFNTIYAMDEFIMGFRKVDEFEVKLENYLTYGNVKKRDLMLDFTKFQEKKEFLEDYTQKLFLKNQENFYYLAPLNKVQREIIYNAAKGKNFSITGRMGTGKTTVLMNIAINAINEGKRVLYVSDVFTTIKEVYDTFCSKQLKNHIVDLTKSFAYLLDDAIEAFTVNYNSLGELLDEVHTHYQLINEYEKAMQGRISDFRFTEIINRLSLLSDEQINKNFVIGNVDELYKHEYLEIKNSLLRLEEARAKIKTFTNSVWKEIPTANNIKYPNQIITLIYQIDRCFRIFLDEKNYFEDNYGINPIENYAKLKSVILHLEELDISSVPSQWIEESLANFKEAQNEYKNLKNDVYKTQEIEYYITHRYKNIDSIDINSEIDKIFGTYFNKDDLTKIDKINKNRKNLTVEVNKGLLKKEIFLSSLKKINAFSGWPLEDAEAIEEVVKLANYLENNSFNRRWVNAIVNNQYQSLIIKVKEKSSEIEELLKLTNEFEAEFPKLEYASCINLLKEYENSDESKGKKVSILGKKYSNIKGEGLISKVKEYLKNYKLLKEKQDEYYDLIRVKYSKKDMGLTSFEKLKDYLLGIKNKEHFNYVVKILLKISEKDNNKNEYDKYIKTIYTFKDTYNYLNELANYLEGYSIFINEENNLSKAVKIEDALKFIRGIFQSNDRMKDILRDTNLEYIKAEVYFSVQEILEEKEKYANILDENEKYPRIYGSLYMKDKTDITQISKILQNFLLYTESFKDNKFFLSSLTAERNLVLHEHIANCKEVNENLNEIFKLYCKIFKDGISRYYYSDFSEILNYTKVLLDSKEELLTYLSITDCLHVLRKYKLDEVLKYVNNDQDTTGITNNFCYLFLNRLKDRYLDKNEALRKITSLKDYLNETIILENQIISLDGENILSDIRKYSSHKLNLAGIGLNYKAYVRRTKGLKHLFLSSSKIVARYLDVDDFDLIIVDDAHVFSSNQQFINEALGQVIVAGEYQMHASISSNLISIMRNTEQYILDYRYEVMPKNLMDYSFGLKGINYCKYSKNVGLEIIEKGIAQFIYQEYRLDPRCRFNYFVKDISKQRIIFEVLAKLLLSKGYLPADIDAFFDENLNVCDLQTGYMIPSDYNIIDFEDYEDIDVEYITATMVDNLLLCKKKIVIYDDQKILQEDRETKFFQAIKSILDGRLELYNSDFTDDALLALAKELRKQKYEVFSNKGNIDLVIKKDDMLYGVIVLFDDMNSDEIINIYRDNYQNATLHGWKIIVVSKLSFLSGVKKIAKKIIEEIKNGSR